MSRDLDVSTSSAAPAEAAPARLGALWANTLAWALLAGANAAHILRLSPPTGGRSVRAAHLAFDAGQLLALGLLSGLVCALFARFAPRRRFAAPLALSVGATAVLFFVLGPDLQNFALRMAGRERADALRVALVVAAAQGIPLAFVAGRLLARPFLRWLPVALALGAGVANPRLLQADYPGVHAYFAWGAAVLGAAALFGLGLPRWAAKGRTLGRVLLGALAAGGLAAVSLEPSNPVRVELGRVDSAILAAHVPLWSEDPDAPPDDVPVPDDLAPWFAAHDAEPGVAPTRPPLLSGAPGPIVLFFTLDSMRAEVLANPKNAAKLPTLHRLRDAGFFVPRAISPSTITRFTLGSLFMGLNVPQLVWARDSATQGSLIKETRPRVAELLTARGVETVHVVTQFELVNHVNAIGKGFADEHVVPVKKGDKLAYAPDVMDAILGRIEAHRDGPLFLFTHFMDAHHPFDSGQTTGPPYERFVSELVNIDRELGRLDAWLTAEGLWPRTVLVVSADHGQSFGQHGVPFHGGPPYEELCRVPLIVYGPAVKPRKSPCDVPLLDVSATLLDLFGADTPGNFVGRSLVPALQGHGDVCGRPIMASTWDVLGLIFPDGYKVIENRKKHTWEVYDLKSDPKETRNVCDTDAAACDLRRGLLARYLKMQGAIRPPK